MNELGGRGVCDLRDLLDLEDLEIDWLPDRSALSVVFELADSADDVDSKLSSDKMLPDISIPSAVWSLVWTRSDSKDS